MTIEERIGTAAAKLAKDIEADVIISVERKEEVNTDFTDPSIKASVSVFRRNPKGFLRNSYIGRIKKSKDASVFPLKEIVMEAISRDFVKKNDKIVCVVNENMGLGYKGLIFIFDVDKILFDLSSHNIAEYIPPAVLEAVIDVALEIVKEGREGKKLSTGFIIGDKEEVFPFTKQLIINPFSGYPEESRNITDPLIKETIKEFAQLDGVFVINKTGTIMSVGTYIDIDTKGITLPGYGTKHRNCATLTARTKSIAVVVSASGGRISIFKDGRVILKL